MLLASVLPIVAVAPPGAPTLFFNASAVHTMDDRRPSAEAWCVVGGRFRLVGTLDAAKAACGPTPTVVDLLGAVVVPGMIDSHLHLLYGGFKMARPSLDNCSSADEVVSVLVRHVAKHPLSAGSWLQGFGWDQERFPGKRFPTRESLDAAFPTTPVWLTRIDGHAAWCNTAAIRRAPPLPRADPAGGRIVRDPATGEPTGVFTDAALPLIADSIPPPSKAESVEALNLALPALSRHGLTAIHDPGIGLDEVALLKESIDNGTFPIRSHSMLLAADTVGLGKAAPPDTPQIERYGGRLTVRAVKYFLDGALGSRGAAMLQPYSDRPHQSGQLRWGEDEYRANATRWAARGWQLATHAIGDRANRLVLDVYEEICSARAAAGADPDLRLRIEHFQIVNESDIPRIHAAGESRRSACVLASMQPTHATSDMGFAEERLGPERVRGAYAWQSVLDAGVAALPFGSDWPTVGVVPPMLGIYAAVTRQDLHGEPAGGWTPSQCVDRQQALRGYTTDAAFAAFEESELGRVRDGYHADFVALDRDPLDALATPDEQIWQTAVLGTWSAGRRVWEHPCWAPVEAELLAARAAGSGARLTGAAALRACVEAERSRMPPSESAIEQLRRLADANGDGCPF